MWKNYAGIWVQVFKTKNLRKDAVWGVDSNSPNFYTNAQFFTTREKAISYARKFMKQRKYG